MIDMFWIGLIVGVLVGGAVGMVVSALCTAAHRGDYNGNDKSL